MPLIIRSRHTRTAIIGAVFSAVTVAAMAVAAIVCADDGCRDLSEPSNARVVFEVDPVLPALERTLPSPPAPIAPGPPPPTGAR